MPILGCPLGSTSHPKTSLKMLRLAIFQSRFTHIKRVECSTLNKSWINTTSWPWWEDSSWFSKPYLDCFWITSYRELHLSLNLFCDKFKQHFIKFTLFSLTLFGYHMKTCIFSWIKTPIRANIDFFCN